MATQPRPKITVRRAGKHYPGRGGWEYEINQPATVAGWHRYRLGAWLRARYVRRHPDLYPVQPHPEPAWMMADAAHHPEL